MKPGVVLLIMSTYLMYYCCQIWLQSALESFISFITQIVVRFETGDMVCQWVDIVSMLRMLNQNLEIQVGSTRWSVCIGTYFSCVFKHKHDSVSEIRQWHFLYSRCNIWQLAEAVHCACCVHLSCMRSVHLTTWVFEYFENSIAK
jgi:hypothetical protein